MTAARIGADVGGTFTDVVLMNGSGRAISRKVLSTPPHFNEGVKKGLAQVLEASGRDGADVIEYMHGATVATNAILTRTGGRTGLLTTSGFRDVLELRRMRMHRLYTINWEKPPPLVPRRLRMEVPARMRPNGDEAVPLEEGAVHEALDRLLGEGVEAIAVCYLHAYANGAHERRTRELIEARAPHVFISLSSEVLPAIKEYERTSTTVTNAYVQPVVAQYFQAMTQDLDDLGIDVPTMVMQSSGGVMPADLASQFPVHVIESGPAAGVTGVHSLATRMGISDAISLDMGGTTAKAAIIEDGEISRSSEYEVGGEVSIGHRLMKGSGYLLAVPSIDIAEVGAGGGSIAWVDAGGALKVGPRSAGADPGPASYGLGGAEATITDANVHLGLTNPRSLAGGSLAIDVELAEKAIHDRLARRLDIDVTTAAWGIRTVANSSLVRALRSVSTERGRDPNRFVLFAYGGMGPVHALALAVELNIRTVVVPPLPGLFSALSLLFAEVEHHLMRTYTAKIRAVVEEDMTRITKELLTSAHGMLDSEGYPPERRGIMLAADAHYFGQDYALTIPLTNGVVSSHAIQTLTEDFHAQHERTYGYRSDEEDVCISALRCTAIGRSATARVPANLSIAANPLEITPARNCYFGPDQRWATTDVLTRQDLLTRDLAGPAIIEEDNSLTVVLPGWRASIDEWSNIVLRLV